LPPVKELNLSQLIM